MQKNNIKHYLHLHFLVFIAGFTAILGEVISLSSIALVWHRMLIAFVLTFLFLIYRKYNLRVTLRDFIKFSLAGIIIALHWITFFEAIEQSNISITLAMFSTGAFFASLFEPIFFKRKIRPVEIILGELRPARIGAWRGWRAGGRAGARGGLGDGGSQADPGTLGWICCCGVAVTF